MSVGQRVPTTEEARAVERSWAGRRSALALAVTALLVAAAVALPLISGDALRGKIFAQAAPLFGVWNPHVGPGTVPAVLMALLGVTVVPGRLATMNVRALAWSTWALGLLWTMSLALVDGWQRGVAGRLTRPDEYLSEVGGVHSIPAMLSGFSARIVDHQPDSWTTHVSGHPPGSLLTFVVLDRIGLGGGAWAGLWCVLVGTSGLAAVIVALDRLGAPDAARRCAPFLAFFPGLIWVGVSADGYYMGVVAWGLALLAVSATAAGRRAATAGVGAGLLLGFSVFLNYGLVLAGVMALTMAAAARSWRPLPWAVPAALAMVAAFWLAGFWWLDGYHLVVARYYQGIASQRPFAYWGWANLAATAIAVGPATVAALGRAAGLPALRRRELWPAFAGLAAIVVADLSALSKAETERIWLPFTVWMVTVTAVLPPRAARWWLGAQVVVALLVNHLVLTYW
ncbi:hypothetical protein ACPXB3_05475 [Gordonia sp. DT219]|uniref:hypothetical protein n=1 Tax=Gordonia sp. DT219 TaxID=3416658 RepID=UPI003CF63150